jgi:hypothetical protein
MAEKKLKVTVKYVVMKDFAAIGTPHDSEKAAQKALKEVLGVSDHPIQLWIKKVYCN